MLNRKRHEAFADKEQGLNLNGLFQALHRIAGQLDIGVAVGPGAGVHIMGAGVIRMLIDCQKAVVLVIVENIALKRCAGR